jgi:hypothetical protein
MVIPGNKDKDKTQAIEQAINKNAICKELL